jgi:hypothetical protein
LWFAASAIAILIPQHVFRGAEALDWAGLAAAVAGIVVHVVQTKAGRRAAQPVM